MIVKLLTEHDLEFLSLKRGCRGCPSLHLSKCQFVGNHMPQLILYMYILLYISVLNEQECRFHCYECSKKFKTAIGKYISNMFLHLSLLSFSYKEIMFFVYVF